MRCDRWLLAFGRHRYRDALALASDPRLNRAGLQPRV
jgi:hypothetical protein